MCTDAKEGTEIHVTFGEIIAIGREPPVIEDRIEGLRNGVAEAVMEFDVEASTAILRTFFER
jgi:hypothetical protein